MNRENVRNRLADWIEVFADTYGIPEDGAQAYAAFADATALMSEPGGDLPDLDAVQENDFVVALEIVKNSR